MRLPTLYMLHSVHLRLSSWYKLLLTYVMNLRPFIEQRNFNHTPASVGVFATSINRFRSVRSSSFFQSIGSFYIIGGLIILILRCLIWHGNLSIYLSIYFSLFIFINLSLFNRQNKKKTSSTENRIFSSCSLRTRAKYKKKENFRVIWPNSITIS